MYGIRYTCSQHVCKVMLLNNAKLSIILFCWHYLTSCQHLHNMIIQCSNPPLCLYWCGLIT